MSIERIADVKPGDWGMVKSVGKFRRVESVKPVIRAVTFFGSNDFVPFEVVTEWISGDEIIIPANLFATDSLKADSSVIAPALADGRRRVTSETGGQKEQRDARLDLIPVDALWELAEHFGKGSQKYPMGEDGIDNWRKGYPFSLSYAALSRHLMKALSGEDIDPENGSKHLIAVAWHALTLVHQMNRPEMVEKFDDRQAKREEGV